MGQFSLLHDQLIEFVIIFLKHEKLFTKYNFFPPKKSLTYYIFPEIYKYVHDEGTVHYTQNIHKSSTRLHASEDENCARNRSRNCKCKQRSQPDNLVPLCKYFRLHSL